MRRRQILAQPQLDRAGAQAAAIEHVLKRGHVAAKKPSPKVEDMSEKARSDWQRSVGSFPPHYFKGNTFCPLGCGKYIERGMAMHLRYCKFNPNRRAKP